MTFQYIPEELSARLVSHELARKAVSEALIAITKPYNKLFPVVAGQGANELNRFSIKSANTDQFWGMKVGSYWHQNDRLGLPRHSSCIFLFDQETGQIRAMVEARKANAYRTAAANAIAVDHLARKDAKRLAIFGAGHQAAYEIAALMKVRRIEEIYVVNRNAERAGLFAHSLAKNSVRAIVATAEEACKQADIIVTVTSSTAPLFDAKFVKPGTHISSMGSDAAGKQELPLDILKKAELFCDFQDQSLVIGEFQHINGAVKSGEVAAPVNLGDVLTGRHPGRQDDATITVFDSSGVAFQDLFLASHLLEKAKLQRLAPQAV